jgi:hypothetical protein
VATVSINGQVQVQLHFKDLIWDILLN